MHYPDGVSDVTDPRGDLEWGTLPGLVEDAAARFGEAEAVVDGDGPGGTTIRWSFDRLAEEVATATRAVMANGIEPGDRVAIWAPNCAEWIVGRARVPWVRGPCSSRSTPATRAAEAAYILRASGARLLFTVQGFLGTDYPALLDEAVAGPARALPALEQVVVLRSDGTAGPVGGWRPADDGVGASSWPGPTGASRTWPPAGRPPSTARRPVRPDLHLGHDRAARRGP